MPLHAESDVHGGVRAMLSQVYHLLKDAELRLDLEPLRLAQEK